jgi:hypothetical protein
VVIPVQDSREELRRDEEEGFELGRWTTGVIASIETRR